MSAHALQLLQKGSLETCFTELNSRLGDVAQLKNFLFMSIPIMEKHCPAERERIPTKSPVYVAVQIDVRDADQALLNCLRAPVFSLVGRITHLPFSGRTGHTSLTPQTSSLHLRPPGVVGWLEFLSRPLPYFLLPFFRKLGVGWPSPKILSDESSPVISRRLATHVSHAGNPGVASRHAGALRGSISATGWGKTGLTAG